MTEQILPYLILILTLRLFSWPFDLNPKAKCILVRVSRLTIMKSVKFLKCLFFALYLQRLVSLSFKKRIEGLQHMYEHEIVPHCTCVKVDNVRSNMKYTFKVNTCKIFYVLSNKKMLNFLDEDWQFGLFGLLFSSWVLSAQCFSRYDLRPSCRT